MPNIKSAAKRVELTARYNMQNKSLRSSMKTAIKKFDAAETGKAELFRDAVKVVDKAAAKKAIHRNAANRKKAQLAKKMQANANG